MMKLEYDKGDTKGNLESLFDKLDDPQDPFTEKYEKESKEDEADLLAEAGDVFRNLLESDGEIHDMAKNLDGL